MTPVREPGVQVVGNSGGGIGKASSHAVFRFQNPVPCIARHCPTRNDERKGRAGPNREPQGLPKTPNQRRMD